MRKSTIILWLCLAIVLLGTIAALWAFINYRIPQKIWNTFSKIEETKDISGLYKVVRVSDGDTIEVDMNGATERVRFIGVDTPETHRPETPVQCFGPEASQFTARFLDNTYVRLEVDTMGSNRDRYDRLLRYVYINEQSVNEILIRQGYGFAYTIFPFSKKSEFMQAEALAKKELRGLWGACSVEIKEGVPQTSFAL